MLKKVYVEIGNICNLNCDFCPGTERKKDFMSVSDFKLIAPKVKKVCDYIYLHVMGEPLMHPNLDEILCVCGENKLKVSLTTNGTLLKDKEDILLSSPALYKVSVSVHSFEANDGINIENYLETIYEFTKKASENGIIVSLRLWNLDSDKLKGRNGLNGNIADYFLDKFPGYEINRTGYKLKKNVYIEFAEKFKWPGEGGENKTDGRFCYALRDQTAVLCDGTVVPCCLDRNGEMKLGNIYENEIDEILNGERAKMIYDGFSSLKAREKLCAECEYSRRFDR